MPSRACIQFIAAHGVNLTVVYDVADTGWARSQLGNVLVEKRECTSAMADSTVHLPDLENTALPEAKKEHALVYDGARRHAGRIVVEAAGRRSEWHSRPVCG